MAEWQNGNIFVAGHWIECGEQVPIRNPWNGETVANVSHATSKELEHATVAALDAATDFRLQPRHARSHLCRQIADGIAKQSDVFADLITRESGKPIQYARGEVQRAITTFTLASHEALTFAGEVLPLDISARTEKYRGASERVPLGIVAAISPFNFPLNLVAHKIAPALAVGCPVILKPAPQTPLTALLLAEIMEQADLPPGVLSVLPMANETAEQMVRDDRLRVLSFTGSARVGWYLKSISGRKKVLLELGGNAPAIVHEDTEISHAVDRLIPGSFAAAGQVCIKAQRLLIHSKIYDDFVHGFVSATRDVVAGDPANQETIVGPLIDDKSAERVMDWIDEAVAGGAKILCGGEREGAVVSPTVLADVAANSKCITEEIFGPVVVVQRYDDIDEAIQLANDTQYGLQAALFTFDSRIMEQVIRDLRYGGIIINDSPMVRVDNYPYGGSKNSGLGREGVRYAMMEYTEPKVVVMRSML